jgi:hypothetical protein
MMCTGGLLHRLLTHHQVLILATLFLTTTFIVNQGVQMLILCVFLRAKGCTIGMTGTSSLISFSWITSLELPGDEGAYNTISHCYQTHQMATYYRGRIQVRSKKLAWIFRSMR